VNYENIENKELPISKVLDDDNQQIQFDINNQHTTMLEK